jgi:hypothetical protein
MHTGSFRLIEEGVAVRPVTATVAAAGTSTTPIVTGLVDVQATVTIQVDLVP